MTDLNPEALEKALSTFIVRLAGPVVAPSEAVIAAILAYRAALPRTDLVDRLLQRAEYEDNGGTCDQQLESMGELLKEAAAVISATGGVPDGWRTIESAPKDRTPILIALRTDMEPTRRDLDRWRGLQFVASHHGLAYDGFDMGWSVAAPVGHGGFPDEWVAGWMPLSAPPHEEPNDR